MKTLGRIMRLLFLLPVLPLVGIPGEAPPPGDGGNAPPPAPGGEPPQGTEMGAGTPPAEAKPEEKTIHLTQAELDAMLDKTYRKGTRKGPTPPKEAPKEIPPAEDARAAEMEEKLRLANERLLTGTVRSMAAELGLTERGAKAAAKLADLSDCFGKEGELDETAVKDALEDFLGEYPEFKRSEPETPGGFQIGAPGKGAEKVNSKIDEIFGNTK